MKEVKFKRTSSPRTKRTEERQCKQKVKKENTPGSQEVPQTAEEELPT